MLVRDSYGYIGQHNRDYPDYLDFGDSVSRCGLLAMCGSEEDKTLLLGYVDVIYNLKNNYEIVGYKLIRHPTDKKWNNPDLTSRDQLICFAAGFKNILFPSIKSLACLSNYSNSWFINKDFLAPHIKLMLKLSIEERKINPLLKLVGYPLMFLNLVYNCFIVPNQEQNQMIALCSVYGKWWLKKLVDWHPDIYKNLQDYWCGYPWRDQPEIYEMLSNYLKKAHND